MVVQPGHRQRHGLAGQRPYAGGYGRVVVACAVAADLDETGDHPRDKLRRGGAMFMARKLDELPRRTVGVTGLVDRAVPPRGDAVVALQQIEELPQGISQVRPGNDRIEQAMLKVRLSCVRPLWQLRLATLNELACSTVPNQRSWLGKDEVGEADKAGVGRTGCGVGEHTDVWQTGLTVTLCCADNPWALHQCKQAFRHPGATGRDNGDDRQLAARCPFERTGQPFSRGDSNRAPKERIVDDGDADLNREDLCRAGKGGLGQAGAALRLDHLLAVGPASHEGEGVDGSDAAVVLME